jgi:hypothetical protein
VLLVDLNPAMVAEISTRSILTRFNRNSFTSAKVVKKAAKRIPAEGANYRQRIKKMPTADYQKGRGRLM